MFKLFNNITSHCCAFVYKSCEIDFPYDFPPQYQPSSPRQHDEEGQTTIIAP